MTDEQWEMYKGLIEREKVILFRKPPWKCMYCRNKTVDKFIFDESGEFLAYCSTCKKPVVGSAIVKDYHTEA